MDCTLNEQFICTDITGNQIKSNIKMSAQVLISLALHDQSYLIKGKASLLKEHISYTRQFRVNRCTEIGAPIYSQRVTARAT